MNRCDTMTIEAFETNLLIQVGKHVEPSKVDELYNSGCCYFECVDIAMGDFINKQEIDRLNQILLHTLNTSIKTFNVRCDVSSYHFTENFLNKEKEMTLLRLKTIRKGFFKRDKKYINEQAVLKRVNEAIYILSNINTIKDLKKIVNG